MTTGPRQAVRTLIIIKEYCYAENIKTWYGIIVGVPAGDFVVCVVFFGSETDFAD